jgi:1-acyl-sn-glycerol-3-phosphate acyltransferase
MAVVVKSDLSKRSAVKTERRCVSILREISCSELFARPLPAMEGQPMSRWVCRMLVALARKVNVTLEGLEHISSIRDPFIFAANHTHKLEALLLPALLAFFRGGRQVHFLVDWNYLLYPGLETLIRLNRPIVVTRKPAKPAWLNAFRPLYRSAVPVFARARQYLDSNRSIGIFPEGTRNRDPEQLMRGLRGAAKLSIETGAPVFPAGIRFTTAATKEFSPFCVQFGEPLYPRGAGSTANIPDWHARIMREISRLSGKSWNPSNSRRKYEE